MKTVVHQNINKCDIQNQYINNSKINIQKKKFSKQKKNPNRVEFFSLNAKQNFTKLKQIFIITFIPYYYNQKYYIRI